MRRRSLLGERHPGRSTKTSGSREKPPRLCEAKQPLAHLLAMLDATTVEAAIDNLEHHFGKDAKIIDMLLARRSAEPARYDEAKDWLVILESICQNREAMMANRHRVLAECRQRVADLALKVEPWERRAS